MIKAVIFDYGKVLSGAKGTSARKDIAEAFGVDDIAMGECMRQLIPLFNTEKIDEPKFWERVSSLLNKPIPQNPENLWRKSFLEHFALNEPMLAYAKSLQTRGLKIGILSNNIPPWTDIIRGKGGYEGFDDVVISCEVGFAKPDPKIYKLALDRMKVAGDESLFVDDKEENLEVAKSLGMNTVLAENPDQIIQEIEKILSSK